MGFINYLARSRNFSERKRRRQWGCRPVLQKREKNIKRNRERREIMEQLKTDMEGIGEGQKRIKEGQQEIRQKFEEIESECHKLKEETRNIAKQSDCNQIRINLMFSILKARQDNNFAYADHLTQLLREEMEKQKQGSQALANCGCPTAYD